MLWLITLVAKDKDGKPASGAQVTLEALDAADAKKAGKAWIEDHIDGDLDGAEYTVTAVKPAPFGAKATNAAEIAAPVMPENPGAEA